MPMYKLLFRTNGVLGNTNVQLQVNGTSATTLDVQAHHRHASGALEHGLERVFHEPEWSEHPEQPGGRRHAVAPSQVLTVSNITGIGTFTQNGDGSNGPGYYTDQGPEEAEGDWCATAG